MTNSDANKMIAALEEQLLDLEDRIANKQFNKDEIVEAFKDNTPSARANGINVLATAVKEVAERAEFLIKMEQVFPSESRIGGLKRRFAACGQHLMDMISLMEEWDNDSSSTDDDDLDMDDFDTEDDEPVVHKQKSFNSEAAQRLAPIREHIAKYQCCLDSGCSHTVGLKTDGTVVAIGEDWGGNLNVSDWQNIVAISAGDYHTVGLKADGTVVAAGKNDGDDDVGDEGRCNVSEWRDIVAISASFLNTVGLKADGTVVAVGCAQWCKGVEKWHDIVAVSAGNHHTVGLKADGTVVAVGDNDEGQCNVSGWRDIVAISAIDTTTEGLRADGTVIATQGSHLSSSWRDIVAISGYGGIKADGTIAVYGDKDVDSDWCDIVAICAFGLLKADGTVIPVGDNDDGACDTYDWKNIGPVPKEKYSQMIREIEMQNNQADKIWNEYNSRRQVKSKQCPLCNETIKGFFNSNTHCKTCHSIIQQINGTYGFTEELLKKNILKIHKRRFGEN